MGEVEGPQVSGRIWPTGFHSWLLSDLRLFPLAHPLSHLSDTVYLTAGNHPCDPGPRAFP